MEEKRLTRLIFKFILFAGLVCLGVIYSKELLVVVQVFIGMLSPFLVGGAVAFVLQLPTGFIERNFFGKWKNEKAAGVKRGLSILFALLFVISLLVFVVLIVVPQLGRTLMELGTAISAFLKELIVDLEKLVKQYPELQDSVAALESIRVDWNSVISYVTNFVKTGVLSMVSTTVGIGGSLAGLLFDSVISLVFAIYILTGKEKLGSQIKKLLRAYLSKKGYERTLKVLSLCNQNFSKFISGQCLEAVILGTIFVVFMTIFNMPYALLVGVLIAFTALIPIVGAFIGCIIGAFLILMVSPIKAAGFIVMFLILQQLEGNLIYPRVVGNSVGLPAIWVLVAVSVGGSMFGVIGMLVFIPLMSTLYALLRENVNAKTVARLEQEKIEKEVEAQKEESAK